MKALVVTAATVGPLVLESVRRSFAEAEIPFDLLETQPGDPVSDRVRERLREDYTVAVAVGGDGTVASVAHALIGSGAKLAIVPAGTGNLVARELGIPLDIGKAVALLAGSCRPRRVDAMRIGGRTFLLNAGVGINAEVIDRTSRLGKALFGRSAYVGTAVWKVLQAKPQRLEITVDDETRVYQATDVAISNCGVLAKALNPNGPDIRVDDGQIDVCVLCMKTPLEYPWYYLLKWIAPKRVNTIMHEYVAQRRVVVKSDSPIAVQADGDIIGVTPVEVEVLPSALEVWVPDEKR